MSREFLFIIDSAAYGLCQEKREKSVNSIDALDTADAFKPPGRKHLRRITAEGVFVKAVGKEKKREIF